MASQVLAELTIILGTYGNIQPALIRFGDCVVGVNVTITRETIKPNATPEEQR